MKLLLIGHTYSVRANHAKIRAIAEQPDVEVSLVTPEHWKGPLYNNQKDRYEPSRGERVTHHILKSVFAGKEGAYFFREKLFSLIAELQPDILHVEQGAYAMSYAQALLGARKFSPNTRAAFFTWWNLAYRLTGVKAILEDFNLQHSACAITGNKEAQGILLCRGFERPIYTMPQLGIELSEFDVKRNEAQRSKLGLTKFAIGYVGRVAREKGVLDLVEAVGQMPNKSDVQLYVVGDGDALAPMQARAAALGVDLVHHSAIRNEAVPEHLALIDTLVLPSRTTKGWVEQFGHILIEAMAARVPVIGSSSGEIPNVIQGAGRIFAEGDIESLSKLLSDLSTHPRMLDNMREAGLDRVKSQFTHEKIAEKQVAVYEWMMSRGATVGELSAKARAKNFGEVTKMEAVS